MARVLTTEIRGLAYGELKLSLSTEAFPASSAARNSKLWGPLLKSVNSMTNFSRVESKIRVSGRTATSSLPSSE